MIVIPLALVLFIIGAALYTYGYILKLRRIIREQQEAVEDMLVNSVRGARVKGGDKQWVVIMVDAETWDEFVRKVRRD